jgi:2-dehydropantoate 2-reductase
MIKIAIAGIGGVGGYFGGLLSGQYANSREVEIYFISRGENEVAIKSNGLQLLTTHGNFTVHPKLVTSNPSEIGEVDYLLCCTKAYHLQDNIQQCTPCIGNNTSILPLQNGVDSAEKIKTMLPLSDVWLGCVYLVASLTTPGVITETGKIAKLYFGSPKIETDKHRKLLELLTGAGIDATLSKDIEATTWEKFIFISALATMTSYADKTIGAVMADENNREMLKQLLHEFKPVADAKGVHLPADIVETTLAKISGMPYANTSSMHRDFMKGGLTEVDSLTGYVIEKAKQFNIAVPLYEELYAALKSR